MKLSYSQDQIINTAQSLGLPTDGFIQRRVARAINILDDNKVSQIDDGIFRVHSQYDEGKSYIVNVNSGEPSCNCPDGERTINCKHRIASLLYLRQAQVKALTIYDDTKNSYLGRGRWIVTDHKAKVKYIIYRDGYGRLHCPCGKGDCKHKKAINDYLGNDGGNGSKQIKNECGSQEALELQNKLNCQLNKSGNNGNGAENVPSQPTKLDISDPFQEAEQNDIDQIEGRKNGELAWKLSNGEVVISYRGIMSLAEKHSITFTHGENSNTKQVIARAKLNGNERVSGKLPIPSQETAIELAKRNAARQLLPYAEIKAVEQKAKLTAEFDWQKAQAKCVEVVGTKANVDIIIHELVKDGKLRQDNPSHYDRTEWLIIYEACKQDAPSNDGGDNSPSSTTDDGHNPNWREWYDKCVDVSSIHDTSMIINRVMNDHNAKYRKDKISDDDWERIYQECKKRGESRDRVQATKGERGHLIKLNAADFIYRKTGFDRIRHHREKAFATGGLSTQITTGCSWNNGDSKVRLEKKFDGKPIRFEVDKKNPDKVTLTYPNGQTATVHDKVMYESVLQSA